ncbi:hypothetical protein AMECASPLE_030533, partial [Ameca splendens]
MDQADCCASMLLQRIQQQEKDARALYGEDIETLPSPLLLEEMQEVFGGSRLVLAPPGYELDRNHSTRPMPSSVASSSHRKHRRHLSSTSAAATAQLSTSAAASAEPSTSAAASELSTPAAASDPVMPASVESPTFAAAATAFFTALSTRHIQ